MSEPGSNASSTQAQPTPAASTATPKPASNNAAPKQNPAFKAMGLPNIRARLPSRNWLIFITIVSSWTGALIYDRRQKKKVLQKWCTLVEHIADQSLPADTMDRKVTIILSAPPGDGLRSAREHFTDYVKPVLVAGALDWDVVEGRREGAVRAGLAERIRKFRRRKGEHAESEVEVDKATLEHNFRERTGIQEYPGVRGDIVIGRNTWKEYIRGLHEGWLGSIDPPKEETPASDTPMPAIDPPPSPESSPQEPAAPISADTPPSPTQDDASPTASPDSAPEPPKDEPPKPTKPLVAPPHNTTSSYPASTIPPSIPSELSPATAIPFPHILGFFNTPIRMYRFLNRRHLADDVGRQTAAAVLAAYRPFHENEGAPSELDGHDGSESKHETDTRWEQQNVLAHEEAQWVKSATKRKEDDGERVWLDDVVIDPRIGRRMRRFEVSPGDEERARRIWKGAKGIPGRRAGDDGGLEGEKE